MDAQERPVRDALVHGLLDAAVAEVPDRRAVRDATGELSYRRLDDLSHAFARWLRERGVGRGDRLLVQLPSRLEQVVMFYGASRCGAIFVPINPAMKEFHLTSVLDNAEPSLVITAGEATGRLRRIASAPVYDLAMVWPEVDALAGQSLPPVDVDVEPDDVAVLIYTSGSTAAPKAVVAPHAQVTFASRAIQEVLRYRSDDVVFCRFPLSWDYGLYKVLLCCLGRCEIVLAGVESDLQLLRRMRETGATVVPIVPSLATMIATLAQRDAEPAPPVRMFTNTGAALPPATIAALRAAFPGVQVVRQFGQTECKRISIMPPDVDVERPHSVGRPLPGTAVVILDPDGQPVPPGEVGEIVVIGPHVMPGYWRAPELSARTFRRDEKSGERRLHTGDYGSIDQDGYLYFDGRRDDVFKRKGIRMSTVEIEAAAMDIPGVLSAAVVPPTADRDLAILVVTRRASEHRRRPKGAEERSEPGGEQSDAVTRRASEHRRRPKGAEEWSEPGGEQPGIAADMAPHAVLKELAARLERAKVPSICRIVPDLPLTLHGKNARQALDAMLDGVA